MGKSGIPLSTLLRILDDPRSVRDLQRYFGVGQPPFTGGRFERLMGGGDRPETRDIVTADDLIAVEMLSVQVPPMVSLALLEGDLGREISAELRRIPTDVCLGEDGAAEHVAENSPADKAWNLLKARYGVDWVIAGKVLARKRPTLIPAYDRVVSCVLGTASGYWLWLDRKLREDGRALTHRLAALREKAAVPADISDIRVFDVVVWMRHRDDHTRRACPGLGD